MVFSGPPAGSSYPSSASSPAAKFGTHDGASFGPGTNAGFVVPGVNGVGQGGPGVFGGPPAIPPPSLSDKFTGAPGSGAQPGQGQRGGANAWPAAATKNTVAPLTGKYSTASSADAPGPTAAQNQATNQAAQAAVLQSTPAQQLALTAATGLVTPAYTQSIQPTLTPSQLAAIPTPGPAPGTTDITTQSNTASLSAYQAAVFANLTNAVQSAQQQIVAAQSLVSSLQPGGATYLQFQQNPSFGDINVALNAAVNSVAYWQQQLQLAQANLAAFNANPLSYGT